MKTISKEELQKLVVEALREALQEEQEKKEELLSNQLVPFNLSLLLQIFAKVRLDKWKDGSPQQRLIS